MWKFWKIGLRLMYCEKYKLYHFIGNLCRLYILSASLTIRYGYERTTIFIVNFYRNIDLFRWLLWSDSDLEPWYEHRSWFLEHILNVIYMHKLLSSRSHFFLCSSNLVLSRITWIFFWPVIYTKVFGVSLKPFGICGPMDYFP